MDLRELEKFYFRIGGTKPTPKFGLYKDMPISAPAIFNILEKREYGHYVATFMHDNVLHYFDPMGNGPSFLFKYRAVKELNGANRFPKGIKYNHHDYQREWTENCGRWCCLLIVESHLSDEEFKKKYGNFHFN